MQAFAIVSLISKYGPTVVVKVLEERTEDLDLTLATDRHGEAEQTQNVVVTRTVVLRNTAGTPESRAPKEGHCLIMDEV